MANDAPRLAMSAFVLPPPFAGDWLILDAEDLVLATQLLEDELAYFGPRSGLDAAGFLTGPLRGRAHPLPFYEGDWFVVDLEGRLIDGVGGVAFVVGPAESHLIDGEQGLAQTLRKRAGRPSGATPALRLAYLKFYCALGWTRDGRGPLTIVESSQEAQAWLRANAAAMHEVQPARIEADEVEAHVAADAGLFRATFKLSAEGAVALVGEEPLVEEAGRRFLFRPPYRVAPFAADPMGDA